MINEHQSNVHGLTFERDLCPQYFFGEFSADEINQFFVTPRGYVEVRQLEVEVVAGASEEAAPPSAGRHD